MEIKSKIRERRLELGLTLEEVANAVGVAKSTVKKWESGQIDSMKHNKIAALARVLCVPPTYLIFEDEKISTAINNGIIGDGNHHNNMNIQAIVSTSPILSAIITICGNLADADKAKVLAYATELLNEKKS